MLLLMDSVQRFSTLFPQNAKDFDGQMVIGVTCYKITSLTLVLWNRCFYSSKVLHIAM